MSRPRGQRRVIDARHGSRSYAERVRGALRAARSEMRGRARACQLQLTTQAVHVHVLIVRAHRKKSTRAQVRSIARARVTDLSLSLMQKFINARFPKIGKRQNFRSYFARDSATLLCIA